MRRAITLTGLSRSKMAMFAALTVALVLGFAEVVARAVDAFTYVSAQELQDVYGKRRAWRLGESWPLQRGDYPYLPYVLNPADPDVNELGFRGKPFMAQKAPDAYRVVCLGGSTTFNGYPEYLEEALRGDFGRRGLTLEVINAGNQCWTSMDSLINFIARCVPLKPDAIVVYHAVNDAVFAFGPTISWDYSNLRKRFERDPILFWDRLPRILDHSTAFVGFRALFERTVGTRGIEVDVTRHLEHDGPAPYNGVEPYRQNIFSLVSIARARGIEVFLCTQVFNREYQFRASLHKRWGQGVDDANEITRSFARRWEDVHVIDVAAALPGGNDWMTDYAHFTPEGMSRMANFIADDIRPHLDQLVARRNAPGGAFTPSSSKRTATASGAARLSHGTVDHQ